LELLTKQLTQGQALADEQVGGAVEGLISGELHAETKADFLTALAVKGETVGEIAAFARELRSRAIEPPIDSQTRAREILDVCGTGGDRLNTFNISTTVAIVAASISTKVSAACQPAKPVSVLIFQGTDDPLVPFAGGVLGHNGERGLVLSHELAVRRWATLDHCAATPSTQHLAETVRDGTSIDLQAYSDCAGGSEVRGYTVQKGGHTWPGGLQYVPEIVVGKTTRNLDASEVLWDFFSHHTR